MDELICQADLPRVELVVMSRPALDGLTPGHIMLAVSVAGEGEKSWGFYPDGIKDEFQVGGLQRYTTSTVIPISYAQYLRLLGQVENYRRSTEYHLLGSNCRHMVVTLLKAIGVDVPHETMWPNNQGKVLVRRYGEGWGRCLLR